MKLPIEINVALPANASRVAKKLVKAKYKKAILTRAIKLRNLHSNDMYLFGEMAESGRFVQVKFK